MNFVRDGTIVIEDDNTESEDESSVTECVDSEASEASHELASDLSLLEYARSHGLCCDCNLIDPLAPEELGLSLLELDCLEFDLSHLPSERDLVADEKVSLDKAGALFLQDVFRVHDDDDAECIAIIRPRRCFRVESPILVTDPRLDIELFTQKPTAGHGIQNYAWRTANGTDIDGEIEWLEDDLVAAQTSHASSEKLQLTSGEGVFLLGVCTKYETACEAQTCTYEDTRVFKNVCDRLPPNQDATTNSLLKNEARYESPPLLAQSSPFFMACPESDIGHLSLISSPYDPTADILEGVDRSLFDQDVMPMEETAAELLFDSATDYQQCMTSSPRKRQRPEDFKEDVPLLPPMYEPSPSKKLKMVSFSDILATSLPAAQWTCSVDSNELPDPPDSLEIILQPVAGVAMQDAEHEQLTEVDSTMRMELPVLNHSISPPPWELHRSSRDNTACQSKSLSALKTLLREERPWRQGNIDHDVKVWEPFPSHLGMVARQEQFDDGSLARYLATLSFRERIIHVWKPDGLRVLDANDSDDDELDQAEYADLCDNTMDLGDLQSLLDRHQLKLRGEDQTPDLTNDIQKIKVEAHRLDHVTAQQGTTKEVAATPYQANPGISTVGEAFSATNSLSRFMQTQAAVVTDKEVNGPVVTGTQKARHHVAQVTKEDTTHSIVQDSPPPSLQIPIPSIGVASGESPRQFILSSRLLLRRLLVQRIEHHYPAAQFVDRDFESEIALLGRATQPSRAEADIALSPSTGLVFTTLQEIKQKPLPGQAHHAGIRERIDGVALRYEQLIVLVSEGQSSQPVAAFAGSMLNLDERDCAALTSLITFATRITSDVRVLYVPGGQDTLAQWTVSCMIKYGISTSVVDLVLDETLWELFLRAAGMNAFAAQAVLAALKAPLSLPEPDDMDDTSSSDAFGLGAFVRMRPGERKYRFSGVMGGDRVLERTGRLLDQGWTSGVR